MKMENIETEILNRQNQQNGYMNEIEMLKNRLKYIEDEREQEKKQNMDALEELDEEKRKYWE